MWVWVFYYYAKELCPPKYKKEKYQIQQKRWHNSLENMLDKQGIN